MKKVILAVSVLVALLFVGCAPEVNTVISNPNKSNNDNQSMIDDFTSSASDTVSKSIEEEANENIEFITNTGKDRLGLSAVVGQIQSSVVAINVTGTASYYYYTYPTEGSGSGVIISDDGYIVTNNHVISGGEDITVFLNDNSSYSARIVGTDSVTDIAVLKIDAEGLTPAPFGDSSTLRVGDFALAIGNPLGEYQGSVTFGIVSALNREVNIDNETHTMFQVDAAVNPGNSGGGMFDTNGMLIGIVTAKNISEEVEGLGFVLPVNNIKPVVEDLINHGYVTGRPDLGFDPVEITSMRTAQYYGLNKLGIYVKRVTPGSYAEQCGLMYRDYINAADGESIATIDRLEEILAGKKVGDTIVLEVCRGSDVLDVVLIIGERTN